MESGKSLYQVRAGMEISDPSYHLPHFYHLFAKFSDERDHAFWAEAEAASRRYIALCAHPVTGLSPNMRHMTARRC